VTLYPCMRVFSRGVCYLAIHVTLLPP
jgi:hypothetical protein